MRPFGKSIKSQFNLLLSILTFMGIVVIGVLGVRAIITSGNDAGTLTAASMRERAEQLLVQTVAATASKNSLSLVNIQQQTATAAETTRQVLENPTQFTRNDWKFNTKVTQLPDGQWSNSAEEAGSVFIPNTAPITPAVKKEVETTSYLDYIFPQILKNTPDAIALFYNSELVIARYYPNIGLATITPPDTPIKELEFYTVATPENNPEKTAKWTTVYDDPAGNGLLISAIYPTYLSTGAFAGSTGMDVSLSSVAQRIEDYSPIEQSYAFLIDNQGRAIALPGQGYKDMLDREQKDKEFGPDLNDVKGDFGAVLGEMKAGKSDFREVSTGGQRLYVAYAPVENTPFSLGIVAKQDILLRVVDDVRAQVATVTRNVLYYQMLPFGLGIFALLVWVGFLYTRLITKPIVEITEKTHRVMQGDFRQRITITSLTASNEIGRLSEAFNTMTKKLATSYQALEQKVQERTQTLNVKVRELADAKAKDDAILASIGEGMIVTDSSGYVMLINQVAAELLGMDHEASVGKQVNGDMLLGQDGKPLAAKEQPLSAALSTGKKITQAVQIAHGSAKRTLNVTATPVMEGEHIIGAIQILRDITKEKEVDRMKTEFISIASHQLRTPLSAIKWFSEMLLNGDGGKLKGEQHEFVSNISDSTERMIELVNSLLNISRMESGRIIVDPKPTDLIELVSGIVNDLKGKIEERKHAMVISIHKDLPKINLDPRLIGQVYLNLLTNAIKYTPKGGEILVMVSRKGDEIISQVTDNGFGIPKTEQAKMFQKFFRATNVAKEETDGTGLGMYLVKAVIESSGGKIWFESEEGKGTTFWFSIPVAGMQAKAGEVTLD